MLMQPLGIRLQQGLSLFAPASLVQPSGGDLVQRGAQQFRWEVRRGALIGRQGNLRFPGHGEIATGGGGEKITYLPGLLHQGPFVGAEQVTVIGGGANLVHRPYHPASGIDRAVHQGFPGPVTAKAGIGDALGQLLGAQFTHTAVHQDDPVGIAAIGPHQMAHHGQPPRCWIERQALAHQVSWPLDTGVGQGLDRLQAGMVDGRDALQRLPQAASHQQPITGEYPKVRRAGQQVLQRIATVGVMDHQFDIQPDFLVPTAFPRQVQTSRIRPGVKIFQHDPQRHHRSLLQPAVP